MGIFDLFKSSPEGNKKPAASSSQGEPSSPEELANHKRKTNFYKFAFAFFPKNLFSRPESTIMVFAEGMEKGLESLLSMFNSLAGGELTKDDVTSCKLSYYDGFKGGKCVLLVSYPNIDAPTGNLYPVFGPYHSAIIYSPANLKEVQYFVLCQGFEGKTSIREVNATGMNINCGAGPESKDGEAFLKMLEGMG